MKSMRMLYARMKFKRMSDARTSLTLRAFIWCMVGLLVKEHVLATILPPNYQLYNTTNTLTFFEGNVQLKTNTWIIIHKIDLRQLLTLDNQLTHHVVKIRKQIGMITSKPLQRLLEETKKKLALNIHTVSSELEILETQITNDRSRRDMSFCPLCGKIAHYLFGLTTTSDEEKLKSKIRTLTQSTEEMVHVEEENLTVLKILTQNQEKLKNAIEGVVNITKSLEDNMLEVEHAAIDTQNFLVVKNELDKLQHITDVSLQHIKEISSGLVNAGNGLVTPEILPAKNLKQIIEMIHSTGKHVISFDNTLLSVYNLMEAKVAIKGNILTFLYHIPLKDPRAELTIYRVWNLPTITNSTLSLTLELEPYILVSGDKKYVVPTSSAYVSGCKRNQNTMVCSNTHLIDANASCEGRIITLQDKSECPLSLRSPKPLIMGNLPTQALVYSPIEMSSSLICSTPLHEETISIAGLMVITIHSDCKLRIGDSTIVGKSMINSTINTRMILGPIMEENLNISSFTIRKLETSKLNLNFVNLTHLQNSISELRSNVFMKHVRSNIHFYLITIMAVVAVIILTLVGMYYKLKPKSLITSAARIIMPMSVNK